MIMVRPCRNLGSWNLVSGRVQLEKGSQDLQGRDFRSFRLLACRRVALILVRTFLRPGADFLAGPARELQGRNACGMMFFHWAAHDGGVQGLCERPQ